MKLKFDFLILILIPLLLINKLIAQDDSREIRYSLKDYLLKIETIHKVKFSYSDSVIDKKFVTSDNSNGEIQFILTQLRKETSLKYEMLRERYIIVTDIKLNNDYKYCGFIYDEKQKTPIESANVLVKRLRRGVSSNSYGFFGFNNITELDSIVISCLGFKPKTILFENFKKKKCVEIYLSKEITELEEVVVADYISEGLQNQVDGSVVVSPQKLTAISGLTEPDIFQTIQFLPGINSPYETASDIFIRGGSPEQNLVLFDGLKMYNASHLFGMISPFNPYTINDVKIYKGGTSVEYGNHVSGVVDIQTKKQIPNKIKGGVGVNMTHFDAYLNIPIGKKIGVLVSGRRSLFDVFETPTFTNFSSKVFQNSVIGSNKSLIGPTYQNKNDLNFFDIHTKITFDMSNRDILTFSYLNIQNKLDYSFNTINSNRYITKVHLKIKNLGLSLKWNHEWNDNISQTVSLYSSKYDSYYNYKGEFNFGTPYFQEALKTNFIRDNGFKVVVETRLNKKSTFLSGYEFLNSKLGFDINRITTVNNGYFYDINDDQNNNLHSLFLNYSFNKKSKTILNLGIRANYSSLSNKGFLSPRIHFEQKILKNLFVKTSYEDKQQFINQYFETHTSDFGIENQLWLLMNNTSELPILQNKQYTLGFIYRSDKNIFDIDFYKKVSLGVSSQTRGNMGNVQGVQEGTGEVTGIDVLLKKSFGNYVSWINYSYAKSIFNFPEVNGGRSFLSNLDITNNLQWTHNLKYKNLNLSLAWLYKTGTPYSVINSVENDGTFVVETLNSNRLPSYHRVDFSSSYEFSFDKLKRWNGRVGVSLLNIFDTSNILFRRNKRVYNGESFESQIVDNISLGFTPNVVLRLFLR